VFFPAPLSPQGGADACQDFFYACPGHLIDTGFCTPVGPSAEELKKQELEKEVERVKREHEEKMKKKKDKDKKDEESKKEEDKKKDGKEKEKDTGKKEEEKPAEATGAAAPAPRVFTLHKYAAAAPRGIAGHGEKADGIIGRSMRCGWQGCGRSHRRNGISR
jgi:outer membrane biosynthesis protein TonB